MPNTKEYAAIKVIPAIANNEDVQREAGELYSLTKDWLKEQSDSKPEKDYLVLYKLALEDEK